MQKKQKQTARICSIVLSVAMSCTMTPLHALAGVEKVSGYDRENISVIRSFDKLEETFRPSSTDDSVYSISVDLNTPLEEIGLPDELSVEVIRTAGADEIFTQEESDAPGNKADVPEDKADVSEDKDDVSEDKDDVSEDKDDVSGDKAHVSGDKAHVSEDKADVSEDKNDVSEDKADVPEDKADVFEDKADTAEDKAHIPDESAFLEEKDVITAFGKANAVFLLSESETIPVTWKSNKKYNSVRNNKFIFTAQLPEGYELANEVSVPQIYVFVGKQARAASAAEAITFDFALPGVEATSAEIREDGTVIQPADPTHEGYVFGGWFDLDMFNSEFINNNLTESKTVRATWTKDGKTYRLQPLDLSTISASNLQGSYLDVDIYYNMAEGWSYDFQHSLRLENFHIETAGNQPSIKLAEDSNFRLKKANSVTHTGNKLAIERAKGKAIDFSQTNPNTYGSLTVKSSGDYGISHDVRILGGGVEIIGKKKGINAKLSVNDSPKPSAVIAGENRETATLTTVENINNGEFKYIKVNYAPSITFDPATPGGAATPAEIDEIDRKVTVPEDPTYEDYTFDGWYYTEEEGNPDFVNDNLEFANKTVRAKWSKGEGEAKKYYRLQPLDLSTISQADTQGSYRNNGVYSNEFEGWIYAQSEGKLTLNNSHFVTKDKAPSILLNDKEIICLNGDNTVTNAGTGADAGAAVANKGAANTNSQIDIIQATPDYSTLTLKSDAAYGIVGNTQIQSGGVTIIGTPKGINGSLVKSDTLTAPCIITAGNTSADAADKTVSEINAGSFPYIKVDYIPTVIFDPAFPGSEAICRTIKDGLLTDAVPTAADIVPAPKGYIFSGWYYADGTMFENSSLGTQNKTVRAKWTKDGKTYRLEPIITASLSSDNLQGSMESPEGTFKNVTEGWELVNSQSSPIMTLNNLNIAVTDTAVPEDPANYHAGLQLSAGTSLRLKGSNSVKVISDKSSVYGIYGGAIGSPGTVVIAQEGESGTLDVDAGSSPTKNNNIYAVYADKLTVNSGDLTAKTSGFNSGQNNISIAAKKEMKINNGNVTAEATGPASIGVQVADGSGKAEVMGGSLTASGLKTAVGALDATLAVGSDLTLLNSKAGSTAADAQTRTLKEINDGSFNYVKIRYKTPVAITGLLAPAGRTYNGKAIADSDFGAPVYTPSWTGTPIYTYYEGSNVSAAPLTETPADAGSYTLQVSIPAEDEDYSGSVKISFSIRKAPVTVGPDSYQIRKNTALPVYELKYSGLIDDETLMVSAATLECKKDGADVTGSRAGNFDIVWKEYRTANFTDGSGKSANYDITKLEKGILSVYSVSGGGSEGTYTSVPANYQGMTKIIGNVRVPIYTVEGVWTQDAYGNWSFSDFNGLAYANSWVPIFNPYADVTKGQSAFDWFMFDENGKMRTGWYTDVDGNVYYLNTISDNTLGAMRTGWVIIDGKYYYFNEQPDGTRGRMFRGTMTPDGYLVDENGVWNGEEPIKN